MKKDYDFMDESKEQNRRSNFNKIKCFNCERSCHIIANNFSKKKMYE